MRHAASVLAVIGTIATIAINTSIAQSQSTGSAIDTQAIIDNEKSTSEWLSYGLDYSETRHSRLDSINTDNVGELGLAWSYGLESRRGVESTAIVVDGVMFVTASWSIVHALDAVTGEKLWVYDPEVPREWGYKGCCDVVNRGVAIYEGTVFVGSFDGFLHAVDATSGALKWKVDTREDSDQLITITGAPRVINGKVIIGGGGSEYNVRGYVSAYDAESGDLSWRFYTVPGDPSKPFEDGAQEAAAKTWDPAGEWWKAGGGGSVWDAMAYDPELDTLYFGTDNGIPWNRHARSPGGGDNLYLASIVAVNPNNGEYKWHYQVVPGETWDYSAAQHIILADLEIDGKERKVLMQAPKSGFFYVIDRTNGEFISAEPFVEVNWATGHDENGRPIEAEGAASPTEPWETIPSAYGGHNWHPMSFNPETGLVYIPAQGVPLVQQTDPAWERNKYKAGSTMTATGWNLGYLFNTVPPKATPFGHLLAWDPVAQKEVWRSEYVSPWNGGTLTTAGGLVFQGTADGRFLAYNAKTGEGLWNIAVGTGVVAAPSTWEKDGEQYVTIAVGWGGVYGVLQRATESIGPGRVYTFKLGGKAEMPVSVESNADELVVGVSYNPDHVAEGAGIYISSCLFCHGVPGVNNGGNIKNLGYSDAAVLNNAKPIVLGGALEGNGMPSFADKLNEDDLQKVIAFIQGTVDAVRPK